MYGQSLTLAIICFTSKYCWPWKLSTQSRPERLSEIFFQIFLRTNLCTGCKTLAIQVEEYSDQNYFIISLSDQPVNNTAALTHGQAALTSSCSAFWPRAELGSWLGVQSVESVQSLRHTPRSEDYLSSKYVKIENWFFPSNISQFGFWYSSWYSS